MLPFPAPEKIRKPYDFLMFSGVRVRVHWEQMDLVHSFLIIGQSKSIQTIFQLVILKLNAMALWLRRWIPNPEVLSPKPLGGSKVNSAFYPSEVD